MPISIKVEVPTSVHPEPREDDDDLPFEQTYEYHVSIMGDIYDSFAQWRHAEFYMNRADIELLEDLSGLWVQDMEQFEAPIFDSLALIERDPNTISLTSILRTAPSLTSVNLLNPRGSELFFWADGQLPWEQLRCVQTSQGHPAT